MKKICHQNYNFFALRRKEVVKMKWKASSFFLDSSERKKAVRGAKSPLEIFFADNHIWLWSFIFFRVSPMGLWSPFPLSRYFFLTAAKLVPRTSSTDDYDYFQKLASSSSPPSLFLSCSHELSYPILKSLFTTATWCRNAAPIRLILGFNFHTMGGNWEWCSSMEQHSCWDTNLVAFLL